MTCHRSALASHTSWVWPLSVEDLSLTVDQPFPSRHATIRLFRSSSTRSAKTSVFDAGRRRTTSAGLADAEMFVDVPEVFVGGGGAGKSLPDLWLWLWLMLNLMFFVVFIVVVVVVVVVSLW